MKATNLRTDLSAPLPLGPIKALERAAELREANSTAWSYTALAELMREYHGFDRAPTWWRENLRGRVTPLPRGNAFGPERRSVTA